MCCVLPAYSEGYLQNLIDDLAYFDNLLKKYEYVEVKQ